MDPRGPCLDSCDNPDLSGLFLVVFIKGTFIRNKIKGSAAQFILSVNDERPEDPLGWKVNV